MQLNEGAYLIYCIFLGANFSSPRAVVASGQYHGHASLDGDNSALESGLRDTRIS